MGRAEPLVSAQCWEPLDITVLVSLCSLSVSTQCVSLAVLELAHSVNHAALELREIHLLLPPECWTQKA